MDNTPFIENELYFRQYNNFLTSTKFNCISFSLDDTLLNNYSKLEELFENEVIKESIIKLIIRKVFSGFIKESWSLTYKNVKKNRLLKMLNSNVKYFIIPTIEKGLQKLLNKI